MRLCKQEIATGVYGASGLSFLGMGADSPFYAGGGTTISVTPNPTGPTYNGQPVWPVTETTTYSPVVAPTFTVTPDSQTTVLYYTNGNMCINPAAVNPGNR